MNLEFDGISIDLEIEKFKEKIDEMVEKVGLKWPYYAWIVLIWHK